MSLLLNHELSTHISILDFNFLIAIFPANHLVKHFILLLNHLRLFYLITMLICHFHSIQSIFSFQVNQFFIETISTHL